MMFGLTFSRHMRWLIYILLAWNVYALMTTIISGFTGHLVAAVISLAIAVAFLAFILPGLWLSPAQREMIAAHTALMRRCSAITKGRSEYAAGDALSGSAIYVSRSRRLGRPTYFIAVGAPDEDWEYDPAAMRNITFVSATIYSTSPGVADLRKSTEVASDSGDGLTWMDIAARRNSVREGLAVLRVHRELHFASVDEMRGVVALLERADQIDIREGGEG